MSTTAVLSPRNSVESDQSQKDGNFDHRNAGSRTRKGVASWFVSMVSFLPLSALAYLPSWLHWSSQMNGCNCWDQVLEEWFLTWTPSAIAHGHSLLTSTGLDVPNGVNLMWNTSMPLLGFAAAPLTELLGPVNTFSILATIGMAASCASMFVLLRHWKVWGPASWLGGLLYGVSPYVVAEGLGGRLHLLWNFIPPLLVLVYDELVRGSTFRTSRLGIAFGVLAAGQLLIAEETLLLTGFFLLLASVFIFGNGERRKARLHRSVSGGAWALTAFLVLSSYPLAIQFFGSFRIHGPTQSGQQVAGFSSDLLGPLIPSTIQMEAPGVAVKISEHFASGYLPEMTTYIGITMLLLLVCGVTWLRHNGLILLLAIALVVSFLLSLGPRLIVDNHHTGIPGPDFLLAHLPMFDDLIPARMALVSSFAVAALAGIVISELRGHRKSRGIGWLAGASAPRTGMALVIGVIAVLPLVPNWPYPQTPAEVPSFFTSPTDLRAITPGSVALVYPIPRAANDDAMLWQAVSGMRFRQPGGYAVGAAPDGTATFFADPSDLESCLNNVLVTGQLSASSCAPRRLLSSLRDLQVATVIVPVTEPNAGPASVLFARTLNQQPRTIGGVQLWKLSSTR
jgi:hypothetical protein